MDRPQGASRTTLADVAARARVSRSTASRALAGDARISPHTRSVVRDAAEVLGYVPNLAARGLRARTTQALGLLLSDLSDPVHGQVAAGFVLAAADAGYTVIIVTAGDIIERERRALTAFVQRNLDGVCLTSSALDPDEAVRHVAPNPVVIVQPDHDRVLTEPERLPSGTIRTDDRQGVELAIRHLLANGYRDIAYLGSGRRATNRLREATAARVLRDDAGLHLRTIDAPEEAWADPAALADALGTDVPEAVLCYDDKLALALLDGLRSRRLRVPHDVAVVGYDGIPFAALSNPRLTTVSTPANRMGRLAAETLLGAIGSRVLPPPVVLPVGLIVRESSIPRASRIEPRRPVRDGRGLAAVARG